MKHESYTIKRLIDGYNKKEFTPDDIFNYYLKKIKDHKDLNAFLSVFQSIESPVKPITETKSLFGVPFGVKDNILVDGFVATAGSKILKNYVASYDATVISKLKDAGARPIGKTNLDEFAMGTSTENSAFGPTKNPHDLKRVPGGSSGGSAAAVAADLCVFALGSDTGGSVRQPASFCGVVGMKPSYGRVSRHGLMAMASSFDQIGVLAKNVQDTASVLDVISGQDVFDSTTVENQHADFSNDLGKDIKGLKVGVPKEFFRPGLASEVNESVQEAISRLQKLGCEIKEISLPNFELALSCYYILVPSEISANLSRFDGIRYGHATKEAKNLYDVYVQSRAEGFGPEPKRRVMLGAYALSSGYYDAYYMKALKVRALIKRDFTDAFKDVDLIVGPTAPSTAFKLGEKSSDPLSLYLEDVYTVPVNLAGLPAMSLPIGIGSDSKMPIGLHIIGKMFDDKTVIRVGYQLEKEYGR